MQKAPLYVHLASLVDARLRCFHTDNFDWFDKHEESIALLARDHLPSGSGFDSGTMVDLEKSTGGKLVFNTAFHHMDDGGGYDGWSNHTITIKPSLHLGFTMKIGGRDRKDIKNYIGDVFSNVLHREIER